MEKKMETTMYFYGLGFRVGGSRPSYGFKKGSREFSKWVINNGNRWGYYMVNKGYEPTDEVPMTFQVGP